MLPKQLLALLSKLWPQQKAQGDNAVQIGKVQGEVHVNHGDHFHRHNHHSHITVIQASMQAPANEPQVRKPTPSEHSAVLRRMEQLRDRVAVLDFMEREFGTRMVIHLKAEQLFRLNRYLDVVLRSQSDTKQYRNRTRSRV